MDKLFSSTSSLVPAVASLGSLFSLRASVCYVSQKLGERFSHMVGLEKITIEIELMKQTQKKKKRFSFRKKEINKMNTRSNLKIKRYKDMVSFEVTESMGLLRYKS